VLKDPLHLAVAGVVLRGAQVLDLLGDMVEVELDIEPQILEATQLLRLTAGPGAEVGLVEGVGSGGHRPRRQAQMAASRQFLWPDSYSLSSRRAITCAWISAAPSKMLRMRASHSTRLIWYSMA
jgi:hypothetical protein